MYDHVSVRILWRTAAQSTRKLPFGSRVLLQGLVAKSEYNGKRACVCVFDDQAGRYTVELDDDGKRLSLKPEFVVPDKTDQSSLAVRAIVELRSPFRRARPELWVVSCTQLAQPPGKKLKLDPVSAQSFESLCYA
jgi:hypothetical protein